MLLYTTKLRTGTVIVRLFLTAIAIILFLTGLLAAVGMIGTANPPISAMIFIIVVIVLSYFIFKISAWNIRQYRIYDDRLDARILWGVKTISYPKASLKGFNDLKVLVLNESGGIGIVTTDDKMFKVLELEVSDFPVFIEHLQKVVRWDLTLKFKGAGGFAS